MNKKLPQISEAEFEVMQIIWDKAPINTNEIVGLLSAASDWSPKTIQTMLIRLEKKRRRHSRKGGPGICLFPPHPKGGLHFPREPRFSEQIF